MPVKSFIVCGGIEGAVLGAVYEGSIVVLGGKAVYETLHKAPADIIAYEVPEDVIEGNLIPAGWED